MLGKFKSISLFAITGNFFLLIPIAFFCAPGELLCDEVNRSNGFGDRIDWQPWPNAVNVANETGKPIMVILHKSSCPACRSFKPVFANSQEIHEMSVNFVMVNAQFGQEPSADEKFNVDGKYVPRIIFLDSQSNVLKDVINSHGNPKYKYFHKTAQSVLYAMKLALQITVEKKNFSNSQATEL